MNTRTIKLLLRGASSIREYDPEEFEQATGVIYTPELRFDNERTRRRILRQCETALKNQGITSEMKWLGTLYAGQVRGRFVADMSIRWMDDTLGYGLFAEQAMEPGQYIGEYTGLVRRRRFLLRNYNEYCFSYPTSDVSFRKHIIDAKYNGNELRFANHSEAGNCEARCVLVDGMLHIIARSIKEITPGDQITYDYSRDYWKSRTPVPN